MAQKGVPCSSASCPATRSSAGGHPPSLRPWGRRRRSTSRSKRPPPLTSRSPCKSPTRFTWADTEHGPAAGEATTRRNWPRSGPGRRRTATRTRSAVGIPPGSRRLDTTPGDAQTARSSADVVGGVGCPCVRRPGRSGRVTRRRSASDFAHGRAPWLDTTVQLWRRPSPASRSHQ